MNSKLITTGHCTLWEWVGSLYYKVYWGRWCVASSPHTQTHTKTHQLKRRRLLEKLAGDAILFLLECPRSSSPWRRVECGGDDDSKHSKDSTDTTPTHLVTFHKLKKKKKSSHTKTETKENSTYIYLASTFDLNPQVPLVKWTMTFNPFKMIIHIFSKLARRLSEATLHHLLMCETSRKLIPFFSQCEKSWGCR